MLTLLRRDVADVMYALLPITYVNKVKEVERLKEVEAAVNVQTMEFLEKKRHQLQDEVDAWEERQGISTVVYCMESTISFHDSTGFAR